MENGQSVTGGGWSRVREIDDLLEGQTCSLPDVPVLENQGAPMMSDGRVVMELDLFSAGDVNREENQIPVVLIFEYVDGAWLVDGEQFGHEPYIGDSYELQS